MTKDGIQAKFEITDYAANRVLPATLATKVSRRKLPKFVTQTDVNNPKQTWELGPGILYGIANHKRLHRIRLGLDLPEDVQESHNSNNDRSIEKDELEA